MELWFNSALQGLEIRQYQSKNTNQRFRKLNKNPYQRVLFIIGIIYFGKGKTKGNNRVQH